MVACGWVVTRGWVVACGPVDCIGGGGGPVDCIGGGGGPVDCIGGGGGGPVDCIGGGGGGGVILATESLKVFTNVVIYVVNAFNSSLNV